MSGYREPNPSKYIDKNIGKGEYQGNKCQCQKGEVPAAHEFAVLPTAGYNQGTKQSGKTDKIISHFLFSSYQLGLHGRQILFGPAAVGGSYACLRAIFAF